MNVNINRAEVAYLLQIKHIGYKRAAKIIEGRPYKDIYELSKIAGLGRKRIEDIINQSNIIIIF